MKKTVKLLSFIIIIGSILVSSVSCSFLNREPRDKTFTLNGFSITLTDEFVEQDIITQSAMYVSDDVIVTTLREYDSSIKNYTVRKYAELVCTVNKLKSTVRVVGDYAEFEYEKDVSGKDIHYYARCYKGAKFFWLVQFGCEVDEIDDHMPDIKKWADTISVD